MEALVIPSFSFFFFSFFLFFFCAFMSRSTLPFFLYFPVRQNRLPSKSSASGPLSSFLHHLFHLSSLHPTLHVVISPHRYVIFTPAAFAICLYACLLII